MQPVNMHGAAKIKTFFSRSGRELPKLIYSYSYMEDLLPAPAPAFFYSFAAIRTQR